MIASLLPKHYDCSPFSLQVYNNSVLIKTYEDKNAVVHSKSYGIPYYDNIEGSLVYANPRNACRPVENFKLTNLIAFVPDYDDCIAVNVSRASMFMYNRYLHNIYVEN